MIRPKNQQIFLQKFNTLDGKYEGKERMLPRYVFSQLMTVIGTELTRFDEIEEFKTAMVEEFGYFATKVWDQIISQNSEYISLNPADPRHLSTVLNFEQIRKFIQSHGLDLTQEQYDHLCAVIDCNHDKYIGRGEFLDLLTPFNEFLVANIGDRRYDYLAKLENKGHLDAYLKNGFNSSKNEVTQEAGEKP